MTASSPNIKEIFGKALEIESPADRDAFLARACGGNAELRAELEGLLSAVSRAGSFMDRPAVEVRPTVDLPLSEKAGTQIGPYKLMEAIGEGGFGLVFVAEQRQPLRRKVALKIIKPGMDTKEIIARFEAERQTLALMDHPNIAQVLDAGTTDSGRPYFVMELVKGIPIIDYCDQQQLTTLERLALFLSVCQAVQHAHSKGIIHRDLKPTNILVAPHDGTPVVKVIDFGIAKAIGQQLTAKTIYTRFAQMIGTPLYMSPEQAEINALDVDTRSDIYSLGVLLYELLTGTTPFDRERFATAAYDEIRRIIREEEPPRPSRRLSTLGETLPMVSANRKTGPTRLSALVKGDLDWIVMKAIEKDRTRRYETVNGFAADIRRYLGDEPVEARPPSVVYRFRKFARRNKVALTTITFVAVALFLGILGTTWQAIRATRAEGLAEARLESAVSFMRNLADAHVDQERYSAAEELYRGILAIRETTISPLDEGLLELKTCLADTLAAQRRFPEAAEHHRAVLSAYCELYGKGAPQTNQATTRLATTYANLARSMALTDEPRTQDVNRALEIAHRAVALDPCHRTLLSLAWAECRVGNLDASREHLVQASKKHGADFHSHALALLFALLDIHRGEPELAKQWHWIARERLYEQAHDAELEVYHPTFDYTAVCREVASQLDTEECVPPSDWTPSQGIGQYSSLISAYPQLHFLYCRRARCYAALRDWDRAVSDAEKALELQPGSVNSWYVLATALCASGDNVGYEKVGREILTRFAEHDVYDVRADLVRFCTLRPIAPDLGHELLKLAEAAFSKEDYVDSRLAVGTAAYRCGLFEKAIEALPRIRLDHRKGVWSTFFLAMAYQKIGNEIKAKDLLEKGRESLVYWMADGSTASAAYDGVERCILQTLLQEAEELIQVERPKHKKDLSRS